MAYMNQEKKAKIAAALKKVVPNGWKYSLSVRDYSSICMVVTAAPVDLSQAVDWSNGQPQASYEVNPYHFERQILCDEFRAVVKQIIGCLNLDNFDESDSQRDYFHVGHYVKLSFGAYKRPYTNTAAAVAA